MHTSIQHMTWVGNRCTLKLHDVEMQTGVMVFCIFASEGKVDPREEMIGQP